MRSMSMRGPLSASVYRLSASSASSMFPAASVPAKSFVASRALTRRPASIARLTPLMVHGSIYNSKAAAGARSICVSGVKKAANEDAELDGAKAEAKGEEGAKAEEGKTPNTLEMQLKEKDEIIKKKDEELKDMKHRMLTALADVENMRVRMANKAEEDRKFAVRSFAKNMLEVADVLDKALASVPEDKRKASTDLEQIFEGVEATNRLFLKGLEAQHIKKFDPTDEKFDPNLHQAMFEMPAGDGEKGMVRACIKVGYMIHDRVLRPAEVGVTK